MVTSYSLNELLNLRHHTGAVSGPARSPLSPRAKLYFFLWKKFNTLLREGPNRAVRQKTHIEYRYSYVLSNRAFKAQYIRLYGHLVPKSFPKKKVIVADRQVTFLVEHARRLKDLSRRLDNLRRKLHPVGSVESSKRHQRRFRDPGINGPGNLRLIQSAAPRAERKTERRPRVSKLTSDGVSVFGGIAFSTPPVPNRHRKYWYYYRKTGSWYISRHHPYGDEHKVYDLG